MTDAEADELVRILPTLRALVYAQGQLGPPHLLRQLFVKEAEGAVDILNGAQAVIPLTAVNISAGTPDFSPHRFHLVSVYYESATVFTHQTVGHDAGVGDTAMAAGIHCWLRKRRTTGSAQDVLSDLVISNHTGSTVSDVQYAVYRIAGLA